MKLKRYIFMSLLLAMSIVLNLMEGFIPMFVPGVKLGLANIIILIMLYEFKSLEAFLIMLLRIFLVGILRGNLLQMTFFMSLSGGFLSFIVMLIFSKIKIFSIIGVSILGSISHCLGQIIVAIILLETTQIIYYLPFIMILSCATGVLTGLVTKRYLATNLTKSFFN